jgi:shikimate dehydrogenase
LHGAALHACGLSGSYSLFPIPPLPEGEEKLATLLAQIRLEKLQGINVTIPHKRSVLHLLDELTSTASGIGAVNTIFYKQGKLIGDNTDAIGFITDVKQLPVGDKNSAIVLGAGGAARAIVYALLQADWQVHLAARREEQANVVASEFRNASAKLTTSALTYTDLAKTFTDYNLIVNATPVGMSLHESESPWPANLPFPAGASVYDLVYHPTETKLVKDARAAGLSARNGLGMLIEQAACSFELWTGQIASRTAMLHSLPASFSTILRSQL